MTAADDGQARVESPLLTAQEAAAFLRLDEDGRDARACKAALDRLVARGLLRPAVVGRDRRYTVRELNRYLDALVEGYGT